jgi:hypothetical protein
MPTVQTLGRKFGATILSRAEQFVNGELHFSRAQMRGAAYARVARVVATQLKKSISHLVHLWPGIALMYQWEALFTQPTNV